MLQRLSQLRQEAEHALQAVQDADALERFRVTYLGSKGKLKGAMTWLKEADPSQRRDLGQGLNQLKTELQQAFEAKSGEHKSRHPAQGPRLDVTEPGLPPRLGRVHVITQVMDEMVEVFGRMGFDVAEGPELEDEHHNFHALNIPPEHPARDPLDNFYIDGEHLLRTQTSTVQIRVMESTPPPVRIVALGRVYRPDTHDATHSSMFHQIEGLYVDRKVSMVDLKTTLLQFAHAMFGPEAEVRIRPSYFPFTEPSAEMDIRMTVRGRTEWVELGGCGMVDPAVFENVGYDPEQWSGFAFGLGIERVAMRRFGIPDIRWLYENDVRFLGQF
ncbi:MAG: phenylalanine--tRNA ligase subunit alpha [Phycisphaerae bacterium]|nr:phenylalanine--tRNA ligase subunit alpha [Phycisphaerae bacterium]